MDRETQFHTSKNDKNGFEGFSLFNPSEGLTRVLSFAVKEEGTALFTFSTSAILHKTLFLYPNLVPLG